MSENWTPHQYQKDAVEFMLKRGAAGLFADPGLGKTSIMLEVLRNLKGHGISRQTLVIAPLRVIYEVWPQEISKWSQFSDLTYTILHGPKKDKLAGSTADILLLNVDGCEWFFNRFDQWRPDILVVDESTKFKNPSTQRFKSIKGFLSQFRRRYLLTGTPAPNGLEDLFGQIYLLDQGLSLGRFITHFRHQYMIPSTHNSYEWKFRKGAEAEIYAKINPFVLRLSANDHLDMPELVENDVRIDLPEKAAAHYKEMERQMLTVISGGTFTAGSAAAVSNKCRQIASGGLYHDTYDENGKQVVQHIHNAKTAAAREIVDELGSSPCIIVYEYKHDLKRLKDEFGANTPWIGGGQTPKRVSETVTAWNKGEIPMMLCHPASMGHGLNLQRSGNHMIWYTTTWDFELYDQTIRRLYRQGQKHKTVVVHRLIGRDTVDEVVIKSLARKDKEQTALFDALVEYGRMRDGVVQP